MTHLIFYLPPELLTAFVVFVVNSIGHVVFSLNFISQIQVFNHSLSHAVLMLKHFLNLMLHSPL